MCCIHYLLATKKINPVLGTKNLKTSLVIGIYGRVEAILKRITFPGTSVTFVVYKTINFSRYLEFENFIFYRRRTLVFLKTSS